MLKINSKIDYRSLYAPNKVNIILFILSLVSTKVFFFSLHDPEGSNLLVTSVVTLFLYITYKIIYKLTKILFNIVLKKYGND